MLFTENTIFFLNSILAVISVLYVKPIKESLDFLGQELFNAQFDVYPFD